MCTGMPGLLKAEAEQLILSGLRHGLLTESAVGQFRKDYTRHLAEQSNGSTQRVATRKAAIRGLEAKRSNFKEANGDGHINPTRRVATRYDRSPGTFASAIMLAATVLFWL